MKLGLFYLGTHKACWLSRYSVPLFVSRRTLQGMKTLPVARGYWALDSGGFTELSMHGGWSMSARAYLILVTRFARNVGKLAFAAPQDWMCEPAILQKTGLTVREHQRRTTRNFLELRAMAPDLPFMPVLQGFEADDYKRHVEDYDRAGIALAREMIVGVGSVCRRQGTSNAVAILDEIRAAVPGIALHGFGFKTKGLLLAGSRLASSDSMAWSYDARRSPPIKGHTHKSCANCAEYALRWRIRLLEKLWAAPEQLGLVL